MRWIIIAVALLMLLGVVVSGCGTINGAGYMLEGMGQDLKDATAHYIKRDTPDDGYQFPPDYR